MKIGLRGTSIITASGDSGCNGRTDGMCQDKKFHPTFPAGSPYVTSVGATQLNDPYEIVDAPEPICQSNKCASGGEEVAVSYDLAMFTSGGGFSGYNARPAYQDLAVGSYLNKSTTLPPASMYSREGRGYPDVSALGHNYLCILDGEVTPVGGTSAAAPTFGGIIAILNAHILKNGGKQLGFLNSFLYKMHAEHPQAFIDITSGDNRCTEDGFFDSCKGFTAEAGWDPVTGLGSPNVEEMINYVNKRFEYPALEEIVKNDVE